MLSCKGLVCSDSPAISPLGLLLRYPVPYIELGDQSIQAGVNLCFSSPVHPVTLNNADVCISDRLEYEILQVWHTRDVLKKGYCGVRRHGSSRVARLADGETINLQKLDETRFRSFSMAS